MWSVRSRFKGTLYGFADGGRAAVQPNGLAVLDGKAKFRGNDYLVPDPSRACPRISSLV